MNTFKRISIRFPEPIANLLKRDVERHDDIESISEAARRRLQFSATHDELLEEMKQLREAQERLQREMKLLLFALKEFQHLPAKKVANG